MPIAKAPKFAPFLLRSRRFDSQWVLDRPRFEKLQPELASATGLGDLPEGCAASVLVNLEPRDTEFTDKTLEAANPISLEAPKQDFACSFQIPNSGFSSTRRLINSA